MKNIYNKLQSFNFISWVLDYYIEPVLMDERILKCEEKKILSQNFISWVRYYYIVMMMMMKQLLLPQTQAWTCRHSTGCRAWPPGRSGWQGTRPSPCGVSRESPASWWQTGSGYLSLPWLGELHLLNECDSLY